MYRITTPTGEMRLTEKVTYVRQHSSGVFLITDQKRAEGVAYHGTPYLYADGTQVHEVDAGELTTETQSLLDVLLTGEG